MIFDIAYQAGLVLIGFGAGGAFMHYCKRTRMPKHQHGWGEWKDVGTEANPVRVRYCLSCNEVERVERKHVCAFGVWRDVKINIKSGDDTKRDYSISGQERSCIGCGLTESRHI